MESARNLLAQELGQILLRNVESLEAEVLASSVNSKATEILEQIVAILDNDTLEDFDCIEEIVTLLLEKGISTYRHDFG